MAKDTKEYIAKKRQHYVMKNYLKRWMGDSEQSEKPGVWVHNLKANKINFSTDLNSIAQRKFFYELDLDRDTFGLLRYKYEQYPECKSLLGILELLVYVNEYKSKKLKNYENLQKLNKNVLEDRYSKYESALANQLEVIDKNIWDFITALVTGKLDLSDLVGLFVFQCFRTPKMRDVLSRKMHRIFVNRGDGNKELTEYQKKNFINACTFLDITVLTKAITKANYSIELLINTTDEYFITSDEPALILNSGIDLSALKGYMPLTPENAMIIRGTKPTGKNLSIRGVQKAEVTELNNLIKDFGCTQIYSKSKFEC